MECFVCKSKENVVTTFPVSAKYLKIWKENLNLTCDDKALTNKKLCIKHFDTKYHAILLNPNLKRGPHIHPVAVASSSSIYSQISTPPNEIAPERPVSSLSSSSVQISTLPSERAPKRPKLDYSPTSDKNYDSLVNKITNYELLLQKKDVEILELKQKLQEVENKNKGLYKELNSRDCLKFAADKIKSADNLTTAAKVLIDLLLIKNHIFSDIEKVFCQNFYAKFPGAYAYLNNLLGSALPSRRTLIRWQTFKDLNIGLIPEVMNHLKSLNENLSTSDRDVVLVLDEMDGKKGLRYCSTRDALIGYSHLIERKTTLAKKFLVFMVRGLSGVVGNIVVASYATEKGITGNELAMLIPYIIRELKAIGFNVCFVNQDQSGVNRKAFNVLGASIENPWFFIDELKVWTVFDIPHLFKSVSSLRFYLNIRRMTLLQFAWHYIFKFKYSRLANYFIYYPKN